MEQELKDGKWIEAKPLKFKPITIKDYIYIIKMKLLNKERKM